MKDVNKLILVGRLCSGPVQRETKGGTWVVHFPLATSRVNSQKEQETQWHKVVVWGKQAEVCQQYLEKGQMVYVEGFLKSRKYIDKEGQEKTSVEVHAEEVKFLAKSKGTLSTEVAELAH